MLALAQARLGRRVDIVTGRPELIGYRLPAPAAMKGAMNENDGRLPRLGCAGHVRSLSKLRGTAPSRFKARALPTCRRARPRLGGLDRSGRSTCRCWLGRAPVCNPV